MKCLQRLLVNDAATAAVLMDLYRFISPLNSCNKAEVNSTVYLTDSCWGGGGSEREKASKGRGEGVSNNTTQPFLHSWHLCMPQFVSLLQVLLKGIN